MEGPERFEDKLRGGEGLKIFISAIYKITKSYKVDLLKMCNVNLVY